MRCAATHRSLRAKRLRCGGAAGSLLPRSPTIHTLAHPLVQQIVGVPCREGGGPTPGARIAIEGNEERGFLSLDIEPGEVVATQAHLSLPADGAPYEPDFVRVLDGLSPAGARIALCHPS